MTQHYHNGSQSHGRSSMQFKIKTIILGVIVALGLASASTASAATINVTDLTGDFSATNSTVTKTPGGVHFGTYADGGAIGGSLWYDGVDGMELQDLTDFSYTYNYRQAGSTTGAAPYARIMFRDTLGVDHDVILDPSFCATTLPTQAVNTTFQVVGNSVRLDDDGCDGVAPDNQLYGLAIDGYEHAQITGLVVSQGFSTGTDVSALVPRITVNGTTFDFTGGPPAGNDGSNGDNGSNGSNGKNGINGETQIITRQQEVPRGALVCTGNNLRSLHAPSRKGETFKSAQASLRGHALPVAGRAITVDLRGRDEGNFNVKITARYRKASGKIRVVRSTRNLSVVCK